MKKILIFLITLIVLNEVKGQVVVPPGYSGRNTRENILASAMNALNIPAGDNATLKIGQWVRAGGFYLDTTGTNKGLYYYMDGDWIRVRDTLHDGSGGGSGGISEVIAGYGLTQINDSSFQFSTALRDSIIGLIPAQQNLSYNAGTHAIDISGGTSAVIPVGTGSAFGLLPKLGHDFTITNDSLKMLPYVNVEDYGAVADDATNNSAAFAAAVATGKNILVPSNGIYRVTTTIALRTGQTLFGNGWNTIIKCIANARAVTLDSNSHVRGLHFYGNGKAGSGSGNTGVFAFTAVGWSITDCMFEEFAGDPQQNGGGGVYVAQVHSGNSAGGRISNCYFYNNDGGLVFASRGEYITAIGNTMTKNNVGVLIGAGNLNVSDNIIEENTIGIKIIDGTNDSHGSVANNLINHNDFPLVIESAGNGMNFNGNKIFYGVMKITDSYNIAFNGEQWGLLDSINLDNSYQLTKIGCWTGFNQSGVRIPVHRYNGADTFDIIGEIPVANDSTSYWIYQQNRAVPGKISVSGEMYHTGVTPASSSSSDSVWAKRATDKRWVLRAQSDISGGGSSQGFDDVLAVDPDLITDRNININGNDLKIFDGANPIVNVLSATNSFSVNDNDDETILDLRSQGPGLFSIGNNVSTNRVANVDGRMEIAHPDSILFRQDNGYYRFTDVLSTIDTTVYKPAVFDIDGKLRRGNSWAQFGDGGGSSAVSSVTGSANQITASPTTGAVTLSIPSVFSAPGTVTAATGLTVTSGGLTVTAGGALITAGGLTVTAGTTTLTTLNSIGIVVNSAAGVLSSYAATDNAIQIGNAVGQIENSAITISTNDLVQPASAYHNFGATAGTGGYGVRDNAGTIEVKNSGGSWSAIGGGGGNVTKVGTPVDNQIGVWTGDGTIEGDANYTWSGSQQVMKGASAGVAALDIFNGAFGSILLGADNNLTTRTNSTAKHGGLAFAHYTNAEEPFILLRGASTSSQNIVAYGSGTNPGYNSATNHEFYTATNNTTLTGTLRFSVANTIAYFSGINVGIGVTSPDRLLHSELSDATTNVTVYPLRLSHITSGTNAINSSVGIEFENENASNVMELAGVIENVFTDATSGSEDADMVWSTTRASTMTEGLRLVGTGGLLPGANDGGALGSTAKQWSDLFLAEGGVINFDNGDATITQAGNVVTLAGASLNLGTVATDNTATEFVVRSSDGTLNTQALLTASAYAVVDSLIGGEYTPTLVNNPAGYNSNVSASSHVTAYYHKIGNIVFFGGTITATATSGSTNSAVAITLPFASNLVAGDITGGAEWNVTVGVNYQDFDAAINTDATNDRIVVGFISHASTSVHNISYWGSYQVK